MDWNSLQRSETPLDYKLFIKKYAVNRIPSYEELKEFFTAKDSFENWVRLKRLLNMGPE